MEAMTQMEMAAQALDGGTGSITVRVLESPESRRKPGLAAADAVPRTVCSHRLPGCRCPPGPLPEAHCGFCDGLMPQDVTKKPSANPGIDELAGGKSIVFASSFPFRGEVFAAAPRPACK